MADIYDMTRPLGYANGGPAGMTQDEFLKAQIVQGDEPMTSITPNQQRKADIYPVDLDFRIRNKIEDFGRGVRDKARTGIETLKKLGSGLAGVGQELLGAGPAEAEGLMDMMDDMKESLMKYEILDAHIGKRPPMSIIREIDNLTGEALMDAYLEYGGTKYK